MDITVLAYLEPDEKVPDVVVQQVAAGLTESGHKTSVLTIRHDLNELIDGLKARVNSAESAGAEVTSLREERDQIKSRVTDMLKQLDGLNL